MKPKDKIRWFGNDKNGLSEKDFEKLVLGILLIIVVLAVVFKYLTKDITNMDMVYLATMLGSLFVVRKAASYFKPERYNAPEYTEEEPPQQVGQHYQGEQYYQGQKTYYNNPTEYNGRRDDEI